MPKIQDPKKVARAEALLAQNMPFAQVREIVKQEFGQGMSMTTLAELKKPTTHISPVNAVPMDDFKQLYVILAKYAPKFRKDLAAEEKNFLKTLEVKFQ